MIHNLENYYIPQEQRKKILLLGDDIRFSSGVAGVLRDIVIGTAMHFNWVQIGSGINHPEMGKRLDLTEDTNNFTGIKDGSVTIYPYNGYGDTNILRQLIEFEKPDALMFMTDPRYYVWLFQIEDQIRKKLPMIYLNIWDDLPYPMYNKSFYESCDTLFAISKQTENINRVVLGDKSKDKLIKYIPHGIDERMFFPINKSHSEYNKLLDFKNKLFKGKEYEYVLLWNSRNIRRKSTPDLLLAWKLFIDSLNEDKAKKCCLVLHTQPIDENGTDLYAVKDMLFGNNTKYNVIFSDQRVVTQDMNLLYNCSDAIILISSNEGFGLSLAEGMMCEKSIIANVTGGMQDQMRFEDENGNWIKFDEKFNTNHRGKYRKHGNWAFPIFPSNISLIGSVPTPYIYDDRVKTEDIVNAIKSNYNLGKENREIIGKEARQWVTSDESMMSARWMCKNIIEGINETFEKWKPRGGYELLKVEIPEQPRHYNKYPVSI